jgi:peptidoglycan hydrolase-like protein with peptidoglycan-binding domain
MDLESDRQQPARVKRAGLRVGALLRRNRADREPIAASLPNGNFANHDAPNVDPLRVGGPPADDLPRDGGHPSDSGLQNGDLQNGDHSNGDFLVSDLRRQDLEDAAKHDGRRRRRQAALVVGVAGLAGVGGVVAGRQVRSPADEAASRAAPPASRITVPIEQQRLESSLILSGEVKYNDPFTIKLAGAVGVPTGEAEVMTILPTVDQTLQEGESAFEVSGRPVIVLQGELPMYRRWTIGTEGPDVLQLETALQRLGYTPGTVDTVFDQATADAVTLLYSDRGYTPEGPTSEQREQLKSAQEAITTAEATLREANRALTDATPIRTASELLQLRQAVGTAKAAITTADQSASTDNANARATTVAAQTTYDTAVVIANAAVAKRDSANQPGAIDPETGEPYTVGQLADLGAEAARAEQDTAAALAALTTAKNSEPTIAANGRAAVQAARDALTLAELQLSEATAPVDNTESKAAVDAAAAVLFQAQVDRDALAATIGLRVSPGEIVFLPILPSTVTQVSATLGGPANVELATVSTAETSVAAAVSRADSSFVVAGAPVTIELRDVNVELPGTVLSVGQPPAPTTGGGEAGGGDAGEETGGDTSGRLQVVVVADDPKALAEFVFSGARVRIAVASTDAEVLVAPVSAVSVGPDGSSRIEIETKPVTPDDPGATEVVEVEVGLSAQGLVEIRPTAGASFSVGDRVVVGVETNTRRNEADDAPDDTTDG